MNSIGLTPKNIKNKRVIIRVDFNTKEVDKINYRLLSTKKTISYLLKNKAKTIIVLAHLGRPESDKHSMKINNFDFYNEKLSLKNFKTILSKLYKTKVFFLKHSIFNDKFIKYFNAKKLPKIILLENIRFYVGENNNDLELAKNFSKIGDIFIDEAFSVSHRRVMSNTAITKVLPRFFGFNYLLELKNLDKILKQSKNDLLVIIGGAKIQDKSELILKFVDRSKYILVGGGIANSLIHKMGFEIGKSYYDDINIPSFVKLDLNKIILPIDFKVLESSGNIKYKLNSEIGTNDKILDLGNLTIQQFIGKIKICKYVF